MFTGLQHKFSKLCDTWDYSMKLELIVYLAMNLFAKNFNSTVVDLVP
jgi:hypothetical protein